MLLGNIGTDFSRVLVQHCDEMALLHSKSSGCVIVTNAIGGLIATAFSNGARQNEVVSNVSNEIQLPEDLAALVVHELLERWAHAGLFSKAPSIPEALPVFVTDGSKTLLVSRGNVTIAIETNCPLLHAQLKDLLCPLATTKSNEEVSANITAGLSDGDYVVAENGTPVWMPCGLDQARFLVARSAAALLNTRENTGLVLHAGAVGTGTGCIVITAPSGSGKSTLVASLVADGCLYLSDDQTPIHVSGQVALPFPTCLGLKGGSLGLGHLQPLLSETSVAASGARPGVTLFSVPRASISESALPILAVVIPKFDPEGPNDAVEVSFEEGLREVLQAGAEIAKDANVLIPLCALLRERPVVRLRYRDGDFATRTCRALLACKST